MAYARSGRLAEAADHHHHQALTLNPRIGRLGGQATNLGNLGVVYLEQGRLQAAFDHHAQALALFRELGYRGSEGTARARWVTGVVKPTPCAPWPGSVATPATASARPTPC